jgi:hypothetical protein
MKQIKHGWTDEHYGMLCQSQRCSTEEAKKRHSFAQMSYVVETINWTLVDKRTVQYNRYYAPDLSSAIDLAAQIEFGSQEAVEEVIDIRSAGAEEILERSQVLKLANSSGERLPVAGDSTYVGKQELELKSRVVATLRSQGRSSARFGWWFLRPSASVDWWFWVVVVMFAGHWHLELPGDRNGKIIPLRSIYNSLATD